MVLQINHRKPAIAKQIYLLQQAAYAVERDLIDYPDFPPLQVNAADIQDEPGSFLGVQDGEQLIGALSYRVAPNMLDIGRLIVHPSAFRRGIAGILLKDV